MIPLTLSQSPPELRHDSMDKQGYLTDDSLQLSAAPTAESARTFASHHEDVAEDQRLTRWKTRQILYRIDRHVMPIICLLYLLSCIDRANLGNARHDGLMEDLHMTGKHDYNVALSVFFPFYLIVQIPSNLVLRRVRPSIWIPTLMVLFSIVTICIAFIKSYASLLVMRCLLGVAEGGIFPGVVYYLTRWYTRYEYGFRIAIFYSCAVAGSSFNRFIGDAILEFHGVAGLNSWSWIFILEGLVSLVVAGASYWLLHDYPDSSKFLKPSEKRIVTHRLIEDMCHLSDDFKFIHVKSALLDWHIWVHMVMTVGISIPLYSIGAFMPYIIDDMGFRDDNAILMAMPPHAAACLVILAAGWAADRQRQRGVYIVGFCVVAMVGFAILGAVDDPVVQYFACFLVCMGIYPVVPQDIAWNANNIGGSTKLAVGIAMHIGFGNLGGAVAGFVVRHDDAERFVSGHGVMLLITGGACLLAVFMSWAVRKENARRDNVYKSPEAYSVLERRRHADLGDRAPFFRYTI
ncbi:major facilitator superfamily transporter [Purpureocillium lilacinum]|uniref:Major facilitator superfamily transporter n=2 Tax=Purpureocillium lilacinum TaxID=33203 RepID=A0A179GY50_PURLI|nr:hypothetical protein Purlil1_7811 [Purpureocillium lilacinum]OAQ82059.1 major facilitator superfamily transporter [Purpureocillium lilacinum]GJN73412.1 hypothetical protein PLICBS_007490 [Purpureocillium lilacinum]